MFNNPHLPARPWWLATMAAAGLVGAFAYTTLDTPSPTNLELAAKPRPTTIPTSLPEPSPPPIPKPKQPKKPKRPDQPDKPKKPKKPKKPQKRAGGTAP